MQTIKLQTLVGLAFFIACAFAQTGPRGNVDSASETQVSGWACVPGQTLRPLLLQVYVDNRFVGTVTASNARPDVRSTCGGIFHGFTFTFPASTQQTLSNGQRHTVQVYTTQTVDGFPRTQLNNSPFSVVVSNSAPKGFLDTASSTSASGWACDPNNYNNALRVDIYIDGNFAGSTTANQQREAAVGQQCGGNSNHGFVFNYPQNVRNIFNDGQAHTVRAYAINIPNGNNPELSGSPKTAQSTRIPPSPSSGPNQAPKGFLDSATRSSASGWACDPDNYNTALRIDIYVNNNVFAGSTYANLQREPAVAQQCGGNAYHGWSFDFPQNIRNLLANGGTVQAYAINTPNGNNPALTGSPKNV